MRVWLRELRKKKGFTQSQVSELANIDRSHYAMIELGTRNPKPEIAMKIARVLEFDWQIFLYKKNVSFSHFLFVFRDFKQLL